MNESFGLPWCKEFIKEEMVINKELIQIKEFEIYEELVKYAIDFFISVTRHITLRVETYQSNNCDKAFSEISSLQSHLCTGENLYQCNQCEKAVSQNISLKKHLWTHP